MRLSGLVLAVFIGMLLPLQALINAALGKADLRSGVRRVDVLRRGYRRAVGVVDGVAAGVRSGRVGESAMVGLDRRRDRRRLCRGRDACWSRAWARRR